MVRTLSFQCYLGFSSYIYSKLILVYKNCLGALSLDSSKSAYIVSHIKAKQNLLKEKILTDIFTIWNMFK